MKLITVIISVLVLISLTSLVSAQDSETKIIYDYGGTPKITKATTVDSNLKQLRVRGFEYDTNGRIVKIFDQRGDKPINFGTPSVDFEYDDTKNTITVKDPRGKTTAIQKDTNGRITQIKYPDGTSKSWTYNDQGKVSSIIDPFGQQIRIGYNQDGQIDWINSDGSQHHILKNKQGEIISINGNSIIPGSFQIEPIFSTDQNTILSFLKSGQGPLAGVLDPSGGNNVLGARNPFSYTPTEKILQDPQATQENFDKALQSTIEAAKRMTQNGACDPNTDLRENGRNTAVRDLVHKLPLRLGEEKTQELLDKIIQENPDLKTDIQQAIAEYSGLAKPDISRGVKLDVEVKREYDKDGGLVGITTPWGRIVYEKHIEEVNLSDGTVLRYDRYTQKIITAETLRGEEIPIEKIDQNKVRQLAEREYDLRGFPAPESGDVLSSPNPTENTVNKIVFDPTGKAHEFKRDSLGRPVVEIDAKDIKFTNPPSEAQLLNKGADRLAAFSGDDDPLGLYLQLGNNPAEVKATDGSLLYLHTDSSGKVVQVRDSSGKSLNKFEYSPGPTYADQPNEKEIFEGLEDQKIRDDINSGGFGQFRGADQLGTLMAALALGVAPTSLVYDESACKTTPAPKPTIDASNWRNIDCDEIAKGISFYQKGVGVEDPDCQKEIPLLQHPQGGGFIRTDICEHYCAWPTLKTIEDTKITSNNGVRIRVDFDGNGKFNPLKGQLDYNLGSGLDEFLGKTIDEIIGDPQGFLTSIGYPYPPKNQIAASSTTKIGDGGWYIHYNTGYYFNGFEDDPKMSLYEALVFFKKDNCFVTVYTETEEDTTTRAAGDIPITQAYHPWNRETKTNDNLHPRFDHGKPEVLAEALSVAREIELAIGTKCKLKPKVY